MIKAGGRSLHCVVSGMDSCALLIIAGYRSLWSWQLDIEVTLLPKGHRDLSPADLDVAVLLRWLRAGFVFCFANRVHQHQGPGTSTGTRPVLIALIYCSRRGGRPLALWCMPPYK